MIDIHCHLLPGIDDGAANMSDALALLRIAQKDGIKRMVLTPHLHLGRYDNSKALIERQFQSFKDAIADEAITIELAVAAEVRFDSEIITLLKNEQLPLLGTVDGQQFMLLELPHADIPMGCHELVKYLIRHQVIPVIAHPERNRELLKSPNKIHALADLGCWFQLTAGSIVGSFGEGCQALSESLLQQGLVQVVASDAHNAQYRPPLLSAARARVAELMGEKVAQMLFWDNPYRITASLFE